MSRGARWTLGFAALFFAAIFGFLAGNQPRLYAGWIPVAFCVCIAIACFSQVLRGPAIRIVGLVVFLLSCWYLVSELQKGIWRRYEGRASEHWINAILSMVVFGLPGLYVTVRGKYPQWGKGAEAFLGKKEDEQKKSDYRT